MFYCTKGEEAPETMDPETGCGLLSTGQKARLVICTACQFWNSIGPFSATSIGGY